MNAPPDVLQALRANSQRCSRTRSVDRPSAGAFMLRLRCPRIRGPGRKTCSATQAFAADSTPQCTSVGTMGCGFSPDARNHSQYSAAL